MSGSKKDAAIAGGRYSLRSDISASYGAFHCGRPTRVRPIAGAKTLGTLARTDGRDKPGVAENVALTSLTT